MMMREPVTRTRAKVYQHEYERSQALQVLLNPTQVIVDETKQKQKSQTTTQLQVMKLTKEECKAFTSSQIEKSLKDFQDHENLQKRVQKRLADSHLQLIRVNNPEDYQEVKQYRDTIESKMNEKLQDVLKSMTKQSFERKVGSLLAEVLDCHLKSIAEKREVNCTRFDSATLRISDWSLLEFIELSILLFILKRKLDQLKVKAAEETKASVAEKRNQLDQESHRVIQKPKPKIQAVPREQIVSFFKPSFFTSIILILSCRWNPNVVFKFQMIQL